MTELYLILHKVRGEPAFDIACILSEEGTALDPGPWWVIPTSGHRAYPFRQWPFDEVCNVAFKTIPDDWRDFYEYEHDNSKVSGDVHPDLVSIAEALLPKREPLVRRF